MDISNDRVQETRRQPLTSYLIMDKVPWFTGGSAPALPESG